MAAKAHTGAPEAETLTSADVESTADSPAAITANLFFCSVCQSVYRQAKILPCLHSFCRPCLLGMVSHGPEGSYLRCPVCQHRAPLPPSGVVGVPDNVFLNRLCQNYVSELQGNLQDTQQQAGSRAPSAAATTTTRGTSQPPRERAAPEGRRGLDTSMSDEGEDDEDDEESNGPKDPFASERAAPGEGSDHTTLDAIHNKNRLQAKMMGLQGEALRLTYAIDHINGWPEEWQQKREDLKRSVRAQSSQLQFAVKRAERALLARIDEGGRAADHRFLMAAEASKQKLRDGLRNVLHEVNVLKGLRELGTDTEVNAMCAFLLGRSVGMAEVTLDMPSMRLEGSGQKETEIHEILANSFGNLTLTEYRTDVFKPEPVDFSELPVEDFVNKSLFDETTIAIEAVAQPGATATEDVETAADITSPTENESQDDNAGAAGERRSRKRSTADKRRHMTDLGLDSPDVREYLAQFQTARETFRARRREILQQGQLGRVSAASPARVTEVGMGGLDAVRARLRSTSRDGGRIQSLDRSLQPLPTSTSFSEVPRLAMRRGSAPVQRSSSMSRVHTAGLGVGLSSSASSKYLSMGSSGKPPPSPVIEEQGSGVLSSSQSVSDMLQVPSLTRQRRHSLDTVPQLEKMSPSAAAELLTQGEAGAGGSGYVSSRPIRRAISSAADKRSKIEILRETWHRRKEILIQNEGFMTSEGRQDSTTPKSGSPRQGSSPPSSPGAGYGKPKEQTGQGNKTADTVVTETSHSQPHHQESSAKSKGESTGLASRLADFNPQLITRTATAPASTYASMYSSGGGPSSHLLNTVKITIPEVSERTSPTPETMKVQEKTIVGSQLSSSAMTATLVSGAVVNLATEEESPVELQIPSPKQDEETNQTSSMERPVEETANKDSTALPKASVESIPRETPAATSTPQEAQAPAKPTYFFKSRLTGLPVGGPATAAASDFTAPKPTHFFTSRITGLPVGGPIATATGPATSAAAAPLATSKPVQPKQTGQSVQDQSPNATPKDQPQPTVRTTARTAFTEKTADPVANAKTTSGYSAYTTTTTNTVSTRNTQQLSAKATFDTDTVTPSHEAESDPVGDSETTSPITETFHIDLTAARRSAPETTVQTTTASRPFFRSRLTGTPVGGSTTLATTTTTASQVTSAPTPTPFFKSRLTGQPVGRGTYSTTSTVHTHATPSDTTGTAAESPTPSNTSAMTTTTTTRYPSRFSTDSMNAPRESVDVASLISAMYKGNEREIISPTKSSTTSYSVSASTPSDSTAATTQTTGITTTGGVKRELPPLRSAPEFSYTRRYHMSPSTQSSPTSRSSTEQMRTTSASDTHHPDLATSSSAEGQTDTLENQTTEVYHVQINPGVPHADQGVRHFQRASHVTSASLKDSGRFATSQFPDRNLSGEDGQTPLSMATAAQAQKKSDKKLDYPRAHLPDVIPETTLERTNEGAISERAYQPKPEVAKPADVGSKTTTTSTSEQTKKAYGFDVDSEISRGISITEAIRKAGSPLSRTPPSTKVGTPEPLDLQGATATAESDTGEAQSPGHAQTKSPTPSPSPSSPRPGDRGIKGRLKEIARKKKERWRHLTIH